MPTYDLSVHCKDCGRDHPVLLRSTSNAVQTASKALLSYFMEVLSLHRLLPFEGTWRSVTKQVGNSRLKMIATFFIATTYFKQDSVID